MNKGTGLEGRIIRLEVTKDGSFAVVQLPDPDYEYFTQGIRVPGDGFYPGQRVLVRIVPLEALLSDHAEGVPVDALADKPEVSGANN